MQTTQINYADSQFPDRLREIERPPQTLYVAGKLPNQPYWVAIVGARKPSDHGKQVAFHFGQVLAAAGVVVVSGLALGTDAAAHQGALEAGGATVACPVCMEKLSAGLVNTLIGVSAKVIALCL